MNVATQVRILHREDARVLTSKDVPARVAVQINHVEFPFVLDLFSEDQRIPKVIARIEKEDLKRGHDAHRHMQQRHTLRLKGCAHGDIGREGIHDPSNDLLRCLRFELRRKRVHFVLA